MAIRSILIIDDDETICFLMKCDLEGSGYEVEIAYTAEEGIRRLGDKEFNLIILDLNLGALTGIDVLKSVNLKNMKTKILIASGYDPSSTLHNQAKELGVHDFLPNPVAEKIF